MTILLEIEAAIKQLPEPFRKNRDVRQLAAWLQTYLDERWDLQMQDDAEVDIAANQVRELP